MPRRPFRRKPVAGAGARTRRRSGRSFPRQMQWRAPVQARASQTLRRSALQQRAGVQRKGWGGTLLVGKAIEWILNFIYRGREHRTHPRRAIGTGLSEPMLRKLQQARRPALQSPQGKLLRQPGLRGTIASQHARGKIRGVPKYRGKAA